MFRVKNFTSNRGQSLHVGNSVFGFGIFGVQNSFCELDLSCEEDLVSRRDDEIFQPAV